MADQLDPEVLAKLPPQVAAEIEQAVRMGRRPSPQAMQAYTVAAHHREADRVNDRAAGSWKIPAVIGGTLATAGALGAFGGAAGGAAAAGGGSAAGAGIPGMAWTPGLGTAGAAAGAASSVPGWLAPALQIGGPLAARALGSHGGPSNTGTGLPPELDAQLQQLLGLQTDRLERQAPVHEAAMRLAQSLGRGSSVGGARLDQANQAAMSPRPQTQLDPQVMAAMAKLMGGQ